MPVSNSIGTQKWAELQALAAVGPAIKEASSALSERLRTSDCSHVRSSGCSYHRQVRVCQIGWAGRPWARNPKTPHFYWLGLGRPGPPNPSLLSTGPGPARPTQIPHFYRWGQAPQTPHFYWPDPSLLSARPGGVTPGLHRPGLPRVPPEHPLLFGKPSCGNALHGRNASLNSGRYANTRRQKTFRGAMAGYARHREQC